MFPGLDSLMIFERKNMGIKPIKTIRIAGVAASNILSSAAYMYVVTAKVSKLKGLRIRVAGSSFITSEITKIKLVRILVFKSGIWTWKNIFNFET